MDSEEITAAIQSSRYNDTVIVNIDNKNNNNEEQQEILLIPCLDQVNGGIVWNDLAAATASSASSTNDGSDDDEIDIGILRHLRTKKWVFPMLNDRRRNELYETAIRATSQEAVIRWHNRNSNNSSSNKTVRVLDIGSGTGLLSLLAAKYVQQALMSLAEKATKTATTTTTTATSVHVTSLEMSAAMSRLARLTIQDNQMQDTIDILEQHSTDKVSNSDNDNANAKDKKAHPHDHDEKYHLCVSELLESGLLGEGMLPAIRDAWKRHLAPNAIVVPQQARVYGQLVQGEFLKNYFGPHQTAQSTIQLTLSDDPNDILLLEGGSRRGGISFPIHADHWMDNNQTSNSSSNTNTATSATTDTQWKRLKPLSEPIQVMDFDFSHPERIPGPEGRTQSTTCTPHTSGTAHAVLCWWELDLWRDRQHDHDDTTTSSSSNNKNHTNNYTYSMEPGKEPWQDHWHQTIFIFTNQRQSNDENVEDMFGYQVQAGTECQLVASHDDTSLWFSIRMDAQRNNKSTEDAPPNKRQKQDETSSSFLLQHSESSATRKLISPMRAYQLNNSKRESLLRRGIAAALQHKGKDALFLDISDFSLCAMLAAAEGATRVSSVESSTGTVPTTAARVAQLANHLPRNSTDAFQILQCYAEQLTLDILNSSNNGSNKDEDDDAKPSSATVDIIAAEPYYEMLEEWHLQEALNYYYMVQALTARGILSTSAVSIPSVAIVKGCIIESFQLKGAYTTCGNSKSTDGKSSKATVCGFDHSRANQYGDRFHEYDLSLPLWEYDYVELTDSFEIIKIPYDNSFEGAKIPKQLTSKIRVPFQRGGTCHAMMTWIDYGVRTDCGCTDSSSMEFHSTLGRSYHQLIRMLPEAVVLEEGAYHLYELICDAEFGNQKNLNSHKFDLKIEKRCDKRIAS